MDTAQKTVLQAERIHRLHEATAALARAHTLPQVARVVLDQAVSAMSASAGGVFLLNQDGTELDAVASTHLADELCESWRPFPSRLLCPVSEAVQTGAAVWVPTGAAYAANYPPPPPAGLHYEAWAVLPLRIDGGGLGVLALAFDTPQIFEPADQEWLSALALQGAQALSRARLYQATTRAADRLARLQSLTGLLSQATTAAQVADVFVKQVVPGLGSAACLVMVMAPDGDALTLQAGHGLPPEVKPSLERLPLEALHPAADVLRLGSAVWLPARADVEARYPQFARRWAETGFEALSAIPLIVRGTPLGAMLLADLTAHAWQPEDRAYILALTHQSAQALDRARLYESLETRVRERTAELEREVAERRRIEDQLRGFSAYLNQSLEEERTRISRQVHDELGGALTGIKMMLRRHQADLPLDAVGVERVEWLVGYTDDLVDIVRRIASDLRPAVLDDLGLAAALEWQLGEFEKQSGLECNFSVQVDDASVAPEVGTAVFRIVKECLTNILRHAEARTVSLALTGSDGLLRVTVRDDGRGVSPEKLAPGRSLGLMGMHERARLVGGALVIESQPHFGTTVRITVPLQAG